MATNVRLLRLKAEVSFRKLVHGGAELWFVECRHGSGCLSNDGVKGGMDTTDKLLGFCASFDRLLSRDES